MGVPNEECPSEPTHEYFDTEDMSNLHVQADRAHTATVDTSNPNTATTNNSSGTPETSSLNPNNPSGITAKSGTNTEFGTNAESSSSTSPSNLSYSSETLRFDTPRQTNFSESLRQHSWFHSGDAWKLFMLKIDDKDFYDDHETAVLSATDSRIKICMQGSKQGSGQYESWHLVVKNAKAKLGLVDIILEF